MEVKLRDEQVQEQEKNQDQDQELVALPKNYQIMGDPVWKEKTLMSPFAARPLLIAQVKEERPTVSKFFQTFLDPEIHQVTHHSSNPAWDRGKEFCLWSPRGQQVVKEEDCDIIKVQGKTLLRNPLRLKYEPLEQEVKVVEVVEEVQEVQEASKKRKRSIPLVQIPRTEATHRLNAYKLLVEQGKLRDVRLEDDHTHSVECHELFCDHEREEDGSCSELRPSQIKLSSAMKTFENILSKR